MKVSWVKSPEWFPSVRPKGIERLFVRDSSDTIQSQYFNMFLQDVQHLVPYGSPNEEEGYFELHTNDQPLALKVLTALDYRHQSYGHRDLTGALREFLSSATMELFYAGHFIIELTAEFDDEWQVSSLHPSSSRIFSLGPLLIQILPERENPRFGEQPERFPSEIRFLDQKRLLHIQLPSHWKRRRRQLMKRLHLLSKISYPDIGELLPRSTLENPNPQNNTFDFSKFRQNFDIALFRTIRETGWVARNYSGEEKSDFFTSVWRIRFRRFQALIRADIIRQLNEQIPKIIQQVNPDFELTIKERGMLTPDELTEMERQLYAGEVSFKTVMDSTFNR